MESLAILVFAIFCAVFLCGPVAILLARYGHPIAATIVGLIAIWLGIFWFESVYTLPRWLGVISALCGIYSVWRVAKTL
jgi:hypothetical protein